MVLILFHNKDDLFLSFQNLLDSCFSQTKNKALPLFFFRLPSNAFPNNGSDGRIEKKKKKKT